MYRTGFKYGVIYFGYPYVCFLKWSYPHFTPQVLIIFSRKTHGIVGYHHFRKPPYSIHNIFRGGGGTLISTVMTLKSYRWLLRPRNAFVVEVTFFLSWKITRFRGAKTVLYIFHDGASMWSDNYWLKKGSTFISILSIWIKYDQAFAGK